MIVFKRWDQRNRLDRLTWRCDGWFLLGFIPIYIRKYEA